MLVTLQDVSDVRPGCPGDNAEAAPDRPGKRQVAGAGDGTSVSGNTRQRICRPVRKGSLAAGREGGFWRPVTRREMDRIILAAERFELSRKAAGRKNGPLGGVALEILRLFRHVVDFRTGRLDPSIDFLMARLRRSRAAIVAALKALRAHGYLEWLRRYVPVGQPGVRGPQVQQTSNAYRLSLPGGAAAMTGWYFQPAPVPDDHAHRQEQQAAAIETHRQSLSLAELPFFEMGADNPLAQTLARLGKAIMHRKEREFALQTES